MSIIVGNTDPCGRHKVIERRPGAPRGGNSRLCPVHGPVGEHCCEPLCNPAEWDWMYRAGPIPTLTQAPPDYAPERMRGGGIAWWPVGSN